MKTTATNFDFDSVAEKYDRCNHLFSLGIDHLWRKKLVKTALPHPGQHLLDICTGTGDVVFSFFKHTGIQNATGVDISERMIDLAQEKELAFDGRSWLRKKNLTWKVADAMETGLEDESFDVVTCVFGVRNISDRRMVLDEIYRVLRPKRKLYILEFSLPSNPLLRILYSFYLNHIMSFWARCVIGSREPIKYLARSIHHWHNEVNFSEELSQAGFKLFQKTPLTYGIATLWIAGKY